MDTSRNMTEGSEAGHIVRFALPLLGGNLLQQTYNIVDTVIVGTFWETAHWRQWAQQAQ